MSKWLEERAVLVTGAASGIGAAAAQRFAKEGAAVTVVDQDKEGAERIAALINDAGGRAIAIQADVSSAEDNDRMVDETVRAFGRLDVAFLNAGILGSYPAGTAPGLGDGDVERFDRVIGVNLRGTYLGLRSVHRVIERGGSVICTASLAGLFGYPDNPAYGASKHGVVSLVKSFANAFSKKQVRINGLCPGGVATPMVGAQGADLVEPDELPVPEFRNGFSSAQHLAEWAIFLSSPRSAGMNANVLEIDNGMMLSLAPYHEY